ncbi:LysE family translocator [Desulfopila sp. IMCC35008]|uniref:LysE family translocator n=1 Tax=Desulfopila sp. IMCC35008 TaxID=2653858 RepID=UPI0013D124FE|nr:LysE family translocator [Desulfopila sp. IMCC35008]
MSLHFILIYSITVFVASIIPGPSMLLALTHGMQYGARKTIASALGNVTVTLVQASVSIAGLGTILIASETVFQIIKWAGACYLVYIGITFFLSTDSFSIKEKANRQTCSLRRMFMQAAIVTAGNPKAIVFFTAIFPQFINPQSAYLNQCITLLGICSLIAFICFMIYAICGQKIVILFSQAHIHTKIKKAIGVTFIGAGAGLALSNK